VADQAGNEAVATSDREGRSEILDISPTHVGPYPTDTPEGAPHSGGPNPQDAQAIEASRISAWVVQRTVVRKKCKRTSRNRGKKCPRPSVRETLVHDLFVAFGKPASVRGRLVAATGAPIKSAEVTVLARPAMAGGEYRAVAAVVSDHAGAFTYRVPPGPARTLDFHFRGSDRYKHADDQVMLRVPAAATIKASRHSLRNGQRVVFSGRLLGRPYPEKGKVLDLQAYYRRRWRTFATPRASRNGTWRYKYRFQATRGVVRYRFRLRARATSDYPYEIGYSKATSVRVHGP
jgi:hypothetical protein